MTARAPWSGFRHVWLTQKETELTQEGMATSGFKLMPIWPQRTCSEALSGPTSHDSHCFHIWQEILLGERLVLTSTFSAFSQQLIFLVKTCSPAQDGALRPASYLFLFGQLLVILSLVSWTMNFLKRQHSIHYKKKRTINYEVSCFTSLLVSLDSGRRSSVSFWL